MIKDLYKYEFKDVFLKLRSGKEYNCYVCLYIRAEDNDPPIECIGITANSTMRDGLIVYSHEIESIEIR